MRADNAVFIGCNIHWYAESQLVRKANRMAFGLNGQAKGLALKVLGGYALNAVSLALSPLAAAVNLVTSVIFALMAGSTALLRLMGCAGAPHYEAQAFAFGHAALANMAAPLLNLYRGITETVIGFGRMSNHFAEAGSEARMRELMGWNKINAFLEIKKLPEQLSRGAQFPAVLT